LRAVVEIMDRSVSCLFLKWFIKRIKSPPVPLKNKLFIVVKQIFIILFILFTFATPIYAHLDPPGPPKIKVTVILDSLKLLNNQDDGIDGNAEIVLGWMVNQEGHGSKNGKEFKDDLNWDVSPRWDIGKVIWEHEECSPMSKVNVAFTVVESDQDLELTVASVGASMAGIASVFASAGPVGITITVVSGIVGIVSGIVGELNGDDELGGVMDTVGKPGTYKTITQGKDGSAEITWTVKSEEVPDPAKKCELPLPTSPPPPPQIPVREFSNAIRDTLEKIPYSEIEAGNPDITLDEFDELKKVAPRRAIKMMDYIYSGVLVPRIGLPGVDRTLQPIVEAREAVSDLRFEEAILNYEIALLALVELLPPIIPRDPTYETLTQYVNQWITISPYQRTEPHNVELMIGYVTASLNGVDRMYIFGRNTEYAFSRLTKLMVLIRNFLAMKDEFTPHLIAQATLEYGRVLIDDAKMIGIPVERYRLKLKESRDLFEKSKYDEGLMIVSEIAKELLPKTYPEFREPPEYSLFLIRVTHTETERPLRNMPVTLQWPDYEATVRVGEDGCVALIGPSGKFGYTIPLELNLIGLPILDYLPQLKNYFVWARSLGTAPESGLTTLDVSISTLFIPLEIAIPVANNAINIFLFLFILLPIGWKLAKRLIKK